MGLQSIKKKYSDVLKKWSVYEYQNEIRVSLVVIKKDLRGEGYGRKLFQDLVDYADAVNKTITLTPDPSFGTSKTALVRFYKSLGFILNKGKNKDYEITDLMYRRPIGLQEIISTMVQGTLLELLLL